MRLATYNVEWFDSLFDDAGLLQRDALWSRRRDVTRTAQIDALGKVYRTLDADAVMVIEAPDNSVKRSSVRALEGFAQAFGLRARRAVIGFSNDTQQEIALMYDPDVLDVQHDPLGSQAQDTAPRFDGTFHIDLDIDARMDHVRFSKPPLELAVRTAAGKALRLIGAHLKSKAPHGATTPNDVMRLSIANRRKQLAQAIWLRRRIEGHLAADESVILMGDLNDGPGLDEYEDLFGRSSVEILMGAPPEACLYDPHVGQALSRRFNAPPTSARFHIAQEGRYLQALLDYIMVSPDLAARSPSWRIWHPFDDPQCWQDPELQAALLNASDHFPVTMDIAL
ncbi:endonuclease [Pseudooceanicola sediminis]|uniref:Endonuclease n=1 Tax=Pseudooceanicola sediminis TaxID=2211117 RepID=A0A399IXW2_9RHOB|nr:endonuclease/exonuclease/phosphatase family protein [Pseudooceanicola sediminis]RII37945.1 endonuclease [Pseudooceanicola sediminis]|tara:strand:+ start:26188 stop:27201 length:1014 start_codon:yes stop_codon:yes gene_type:complete